ncbi:hypothetical protein SAMN04487911_11288 [Arenibacter nanhaiticus]|uniref:Uncharacterized protein n=1 Tax=Arenibacter nanhaiticus TaxID=558155 RepID=A0A1M6H1R9_9FLAO|nr:hypothetical protein SAMN04487911_11288 [Arenibacter nanhaiticus]
MVLNELKRIKSKTCGILLLRKNIGEPKKEESYISNTSELCPKYFYLGIE